MARMPLRSLWMLLTLCVASLGCGSTKSRLATEQLLVSDAVDDAISSIDFSSMADENVFFDTRYLVNVKGVGFVNSEYIISSLRQQMVAANLRLKDKAEEADFVVEARVGTLGSDGNEIIYGIPANKGLAAASAVLPNAPALPVIPEISVARKESQLGAVKVAAFAYERKSGSAVWQSGIARARTTSQDVWLFGAGPFQRGSIHKGTEFAGGEIQFPGTQNKEEEQIQGPPVELAKEFRFPNAKLAAKQPELNKAHVATASATMPVDRLAVEKSPTPQPLAVPPTTLLPSATATPTPPPRELQTLAPTLPGSAKPKTSATRPPPSEGPAVPLSSPFLK